MKSVLVTGASSGIGQSLCQVFLRKGYRVIGTVRKEADAEPLRAEFKGYFHSLVMDVTDHNSVDRAAKETENLLAGEPLDGLVNNAGIAVAGPLIHIPLEEFRRQFEVNVFGQLKVIQAFGPLLGVGQPIRAQPSRIIQISSVSGKIGYPFLGPYCASKHALEGMSESLRRELIKYGIDVIIIGPGAIKTPIWHKSEGQDLNQYEQTDFGPALHQFQNGLLRNSVKKAMSVESATTGILNIFESKKPKTRYAMVNAWFTNWILPRLLPNRMIDRFIAKSIGLLPK